MDIETGRHPETPPYSLRQLVGYFLGYVYDRIVGATLIGIAFVLGAAVLRLILRNQMPN
jgi:hypothetical protein